MALNNVKIHSVFDRSFNLKVGDRLVNVANYAGYLSSFGIYLPDNLFQAITALISVMRVHRKEKTSALLLKSILSKEVF